MSALSDDNDSTRGVTLQELVRRAVRASLAEAVRSCIPASVSKVNTDANGKIASVDCKPLVKDFHRDEEGALVVESVPVIARVPVVFLTAGGFTFTVPIQQGTTGALFFSDRSLDRWLSGSGGEVDPEIYTRSNLVDGIFVPGLEPFGGTTAAAPTDHATAGSTGGKRVHFRNGTITIGDESGARGGARLNDTTGDGTLVATTATVAGPPPVTTVSLTYTGADGTVTPLLSLQFTSGLLTGTLPTPGVPITANVNGKITSASSVALLDNA